MNNEVRIGFKAAHKALSAPSQRITKTAGKFGFETKVEIEYDGRWLELGRMDDCDENRSFIDQCDSRAFEINPVRYYKKTILIGALVTADSFFVIDSGTDG